MAASVFPLTLRARATGEAVRARLTLDIAARHLRMHDKQWTPWLTAYRGSQGDGEWDWRAIIDEERAGAPRTTWLFALEAQQMLQGLMIAQSRGQTANMNGRRLLYIAYLATAPWNRHDFRRRRSGGRALPDGMAGVGEALVRAAVALSRDLGMAGRVGLHSLEPALDFYVRSCHFTYIGKHAKVQEGGTF